MVKAVKRKPEELGYELAHGDSLQAMTPKEIKLMNAEFEMVASNKLLAERAIKVQAASPRFPASVSLPRCSCDWNCWDPLCFTHESSRTNCLHGL